jgi:mRNA deadenylase 3'-5' endonuclease subunit Ccr4
VRAVTYNLLSSSLAEASHFPECKPEYLASEYRYAKIEAMLQEEIDKGSILCLQEVSQLWYGKLQTFFVASGYSFHCRLYGNPWNDYMGVGIALPLNKYSLDDVQTVRIADMLQMPRAPRPSALKKHLNTVMGIMKDAVYGPVVVAVFAYLFLFGGAQGYSKDVALTQLHVLAWFVLLVGMKLHNTGKLKQWLVNLKLSKPAFDLWSDAKRRYNVCVTCTLTATSTGKQFVIGTYHMPCNFRHMDFMVVHSALCLQYVQKMAAKEDDGNGVPYLLLGDFNWKPCDAPYTLYQSGTVETNHPDCPTLLPGMMWSIDVQPVRSAYMEANGSEPDFTNNALVKGMPVFIETLDYIWMSDEWTCTSVKKLPTTVDAETLGPFPAENEPSDHILLWAEMTLM